MKRFFHQLLYLNFYLLNYKFNLVFVKHSFTIEISESNLAIKSINVNFTYIKI